MGILNPLKVFVPLKWVLGIVLLFLAWQAAVFFRPRPRDYSEPEKVAIQRVCEKACRLSEETLQPTEETPVKLGVTHLINDPSNYFTVALKNNLAEVTGFEIGEGSVIQQFLSEVMKAVQEATNIEEIVFAANSVDINIVACGRVEDVHETDGVGYAVLDLHLYDTGTGKWILHERIEADSREPTVSWFIRHWKLLTALLLIVLIPWLGFRLMEKVVEKNSNLASAAMLAGLVAVDLLLLWWAGIFAAKVAFPIIGTLFAVGYNLWACDVMAKKVE